MLNSKTTDKNSPLGVVVVCAERQTGGSTPSNVNTHSSVKHTGSAIHRYLWRSTLKSLLLTGIFLLSVLGRLAGSTIGAFTFCLSDCFKLWDQNVPFTSALN